MGAISRSLARGYARDQGRPRSKQSLCLQSGSGTRIVAQPRRISLVLHIGREALDKLARATRGAHRLLISPDPWRLFDNRRAKARAIGSSAPDLRRRSRAGDPCAAADPALDSLFTIR